MTKRVSIRAVWLAAGAVLLLGGGARADEKVTPNDLKQIGLAYHGYHDARNRAPARAEELAPYFENDRRLLNLLKTNRITFLYGVGIRDMTAGLSNTVLAYEKDAPARGGLVLMGDGSVRKVSAAEFKKLTLAKKK